MGMGLQMNKKLDDLLCKKYPKMFVERNMPMTQTTMCWGFACGDGWFHILNNLCSIIQNRINHSVKLRKDSIAFNKALADAKKDKWDRFYKVYKVFKKTDPWLIQRKETFCTEQERPVYDEIPQVVVKQVKEKFGTLRFYYSGGDEYISGVVSMAESMSGTTCETCGSPGILRGSGYIFTACDNHANPDSRV
jgi:hypothetical protein